MKKAFITRYCSLFGATKRQARKAWKACDDGTRKAIMEA